MDVPSDHPFQRIVQPPLRHLRILGPPGSGKTSLLIELYQHLRQHHSELREVKIITYSKESRERLAEQIIGSGDGGIGRWPVGTYHELAAEILSGTDRGPLRVIDEMEELILLDSIIRRGAVRLDSDYNGVKRSEKFQREVLNAFHRLLQNRIGRDEAGCMLETVEGMSRSADLLRLYCRFIEWLEERRLATNYNFSWRVVDALQRQPQPPPFSETRVILVDDFQDVDPGQYALLLASAPPEAGPAVWVFGDPAGARFRYRGTDSRFLSDAFTRDYSDETIYLPLRAVAGSGLEAVTQSLLRDTAGLEADHCLPPAAVSEPVQFQFFSPADEFEEALFIASRVGEMLQDGARPEQIAVAVREKHQYEPILAAAFQMNGIPLETGRGRQLVIENLVYHLLRLVYREQDDTALEQISASPLFAELRDFWLQHSWAEADDHDSGLVLKVAAAFRELSARRAARKWMDLFIQRLIPESLRIGGAAGREPAAVFCSNLLTGWERFVEALDQVGIPPKLEHLGDFLSKSEVFSDRPRTVSPHSGRVGFYSIHELSGRCFPAVCLAGCSEMIFPAPREGEGLIPYEALERLMNQTASGRESDIRLFENRTVEAHLKDEFSLMLMALSRASRQLLITAPGRFGGREETGPAAVLSALSPASIKGQPAPPAVRTARDLAGMDPGPGAGLQAALDDLAGRQTPFPQMWMLPQLPRREFTITRRPLSPSALKMYSQCERNYFYTKILKLSEPPSLAMKMGTWFHQILSELAGDSPSKQQFHQRATAEKVRELIDRVLSQHQGPAENSLVEQSIRYSLEQMVSQCLEADQARTDNYVIERIEESVEFEHRGWKFSGRIDRLDRSQTGRPVVIDYKTGFLPKQASTLRKYVLESADRPDYRDWQVPLYAAAVMKNGQEAPLVFTYYGIQPGEEPVLVTVFIEATETAVDPESLFSELPKNRFDLLLTAELDRCLDDAAGLAEKIFSPVTEFAKTAELSRCGRCSFRPICGQGEKWN